MVRAMHGIQVIDRTGSREVMLILGLSEAIDQLAMAVSVL